MAEANVMRITGVWEGFKLRMTRRTYADVMMDLCLLRHLSLARAPIEANAGPQKDVRHRFIGFEWLLGRNGDR